MLRPRIWNVGGGGTNELLNRHIEPEGKFLERMTAGKQPTALNGPDIVDTHASSPRESGRIHVSQPAVKPYRQSRSSKLRLGSDPSVLRTRR